MTTGDSASADRRAAPLAGDALAVAAPRAALSAPRPWTPPHPARRLSLVALVLIAAVTVARMWPAGSRGGADLAGAREIAAYELVAGQPVRLAWPAGKGLVRLLTNLDLAGAASAGAPYAVRVRVPEDGRDETFPLLAAPARDEAGAPTSFFLGRAGEPARTRELGLARGGPGAATLEVTLLAPVGTRASLRALVAHERLAAPGPATAAGVERAGALALEDLDPEVRAAAAARGWTRLAPQGEVLARHFYVRAAPAPSPPRAASMGEPVGGGLVAAYTVRGPGTLSLEAALGPLGGAAEVLDARGAERVTPLALAAGERRSLAIGDGLATVRVSATAAARVRILVDDPRLAVRPEQLRVAAPAGTERELRPSWSWQTLARAEAHAPVVFDLAHREGAPLRVSARLPLGAPVPGGAAALRWRLLDVRGGEVGSGAVSIPATPAPEDRLEAALAGEGDAPVSAATAFLLWSGPAATRLELEADGPVLVGAASAGFEPARDVAAASDARPVLRHDQPAQPLYYPVHPQGLAALRGRGQLVRVRAALRLERPTPGPSDLGVAESLSPARHRGRFALIAPLPGGAPAGGRGRLWELPPARDAIVNAAAARGASAGARVPATLLYEVSRARAPRQLTATVDGRVVRRAPLFGLRGKVALPPLVAGRHRVRVELPGTGRIFIDRASPGAREYRAATVFAFGDAELRLPVRKGAGPRAVGVVAYTDVAPDPAHPPTLEAIIDGGARRRSRVGVSRLRTRLRTRVPLAFARAPGAMYLNRAGGDVWAAPAVFVSLGDDLAPGPHEVRLRIRGLGGRALARFFSYRGRAASHVTQHLEVRAEPWE